MRAATLVLSVSIVLSSSPCLAGRAALVPIIFRTCQNTLFGNAEEVEMLATASVTVDDVCRCQAPLFVSGLSAAQLAEFDHTPIHVSAYTATRFNQTIGLCGVQLMTSKSH